MTQGRYWRTVQEGIGFERRRSPGNGYDKRDGLDEGTHVLSSRVYYLTTQDPGSFVCVRECGS